MSLVSFAARVCLYHTLLNKTYAGERVYDSQIDPIDLAAAKEKAPVVIISTDDDQTLMNSWRVNDAGRQLDIVIELAVASGKVMEDVATVSIPQTDSGLESTLNFMQRQIFTAINDPRSDWADLFRTFVIHPRKILTRRGATNDGGTRMAARQVILTCETLSEPDVGADAVDAWRTLLDKMALDEDFADLAIELEALIKGDELRPWEKLQAAMGWTNAGREGVGLGPITWVNPDTPTLTQITLNGDDLNQEVVVTP